MAQSKVTLIVSLSVFVLLIAFALPAVITAVNGGATQTIVLEAAGDSTVQVTAGLTATVESTGQNEATITLRDTKTGQSTNETIAEGSTVDMTLRNETVTVTNEDSTTDQVQLLVTYPRTYGWGEGGKAFLDQFELIIAATTLLIVTGILRAVIRQ